MASGVQVVMEANGKLLSYAKVLNPRGCSISVDHIIRKPALAMEGATSETRVQVPREDRPLSSLKLRDALLVAQIWVHALEHFQLEALVTQADGQRTKLAIGTNIKSAKYEEGGEGYATAYLPLIIPRMKWVQVIFHIAGIVHTVFGLPSCTSVDSVAVAGAGKVCAVYASNDEKLCIDMTPEGMALFAVPAYAPPIWKTAGTTPGEPVLLPPVDLAVKASAADSRSVPRSDPSSTSASPSPPRLSSKAAVPPTRRQPLAPSPPPAPLLVERTEAVSGNNQPPAPSPRENTKCDYIRLVDDGYNATTDDGAGGCATSGGVARQTTTQESGDTRWAANGAGDFLGWNTVGDDRRGEPARRLPRKPNGGPSTSGGANENERASRPAAARKWQAPTRPGFTSNGGGAGGRGTGSRRQQRLKRRMRVMRANEQKINKAAAAKALVAFDIPLAQAIKAFDDGGEAATTPGVPPVCGYGFGYLGVLTAGGEYEEDEDVDPNLEGAFTLNSDDE